MHIERIEREEKRTNEPTTSGSRGMSSTSVLQPLPRLIATQPCIEEIDTSRMVHQLFFEIMVVGMKKFHS